MSARNVTLFLAILWLAAYGASLAALLLLEPTGDGFTRGLNRVSSFVTWQLVAGLIGIGVWLAGRGLPRGSPARWFSRVPALLALLLALAIAGLIGWVNLTRPAPLSDPAPPPATTVPADG
ncbi:MAG: hypothetical protein ACK5MY_15835 [Jhaorihella sp.]